jgi:hypothetical protein
MSNIGKVTRWDWDDYREIQIDLPKGETITMTIHKADPLVMMIDDQYDGGIEFTAPNTEILERLIEATVQAFVTGATNYKRVSDYVALNRMLELTPEG